MNFIELFDFIKKRFEEMGVLTDADTKTLSALFNTLRVRYPSLDITFSGLVLDKDYLRYGFSTEHLFGKKQKEINAKQYDIDRCDIDS